MKLNLKNIELPFEDNCNKDYEVVVKYLHKLYNIDTNDIEIFESASGTIVYIKGKFLCTIDCILEEIINGC